MLVASLYFCIFLTIFNFTAPLMGFVYIVGELGGSTDIGSYCVSFFGLGNACSFPLARFIDAKIGPHKTLLFALGLFIALTALCVQMPTFFLFVAVRFLAGFASGCLPFLARRVIDALQEGKDQKFSAGFNAFLYSVTPVIGACWGGWIGYDYGTAPIFLLQIPFMLAALIIIGRSRSVFERLPPPAPLSFDGTGYFFYVTGIGSLVTAVCLGQQLDWFRSDFINFLFFLGICSFTAFLFRDGKQPDPLLDMKLFKRADFSVSVFSIALLFSAYFGTINLLSVWLHLDVNYTPLWISFSLSQMLLAGSVLFLFIIKRLEKTKAFSPVLFSVASFAISSFYAARFTVDIDFWRIAVSRFFAGFGVAFFFFPLLRICLSSGAKNKQDATFCTFHVSRLLSCSLGISLYDTLWFRRKSFYRDRLGSSLTPYSEKTNRFFGDLTLFNQNGLAADNLLDQALTKQSTALALADCFYLMGWIMVFLLVTLSIFSLIRRGKTERNSPSPS